MKTSTAFYRGAPRRMRGLSLIELMISIAIGLVLMVAVVSAYLGASNASRVSETQSRMNEDAQAALSILAQQVRMAGNNPKRANYAPDSSSNPAFNGTSTLALRGCNQPWSDVTTAASNAALTCPASGSGKHSIAIAYEADEYNTVKNASNRATDCLGQTLTQVTGTANVVVTTSPFVVSQQNVNYYVADNRFYVGTSTASVTPSLFCRGNGATSGQPLVENVDDLQFSYGTALATATTTLSVKGYLNALEIGGNTSASPSNADLAALTTDILRWKKVSTVRICIVVRSESAVAPDSNSARYIKCDGTVETSPPDLKLRRAYSTTVVLRNRVSTD